MGQSARGEVAEMDFGRLGCSFSVGFLEVLTLRGIHHGPGNHGSGSAQPSPRPPPRPGSGAPASWSGVHAVFEDQIACNIVARSEGIRTS